MTAVRDETGTLLPGLAARRDADEGHAHALLVASGPSPTFEAVIANGATLSGAVDLGTSRLAALQIPAAFTGTAVTFQGSLNGIDYFTVYKDDGTAYTLTVSTSRIVVVDLAVFAALRYVKVQAGSAQAAQRTIGLAAIA